jgi:hypothetical protein
MDLDSRVGWNQSVHHIHTDVGSVRGREAEMMPTCRRACDFCGGAKPDYAFTAAHIRQWWDREIIEIQRLALTIDFQR